MDVTPPPFPLQSVTRIFHPFVFMWLNQDFILVKSISVV